MAKQYTLNECQMIIVEWLMYGTTDINEIIEEHMYYQDIMDTSVKYTVEQMKTAYSQLAQATDTSAENDM